MGNSKKNSRKVNPKIHERKIMLKFIAIGVLSYIALFIMAIIQKIKETFIKLFYGKYLGRN
jgi:hypothetical protein